MNLYRPALKKFAAIATVFAAAGGLAYYPLISQLSIQIGSMTKE